MAQVKDNIIYAVSQWILYPLVKICCHYHYQKLPKIEGPYLLLCNHTSDWDPTFVGVATRKTTYFVATENICRMGFRGYLLRSCYHPIIHYKGTMGTKIIREVLGRIKKGQSVALFPEGNRSFNGLTCPIPVGTAKLAKLLNATLVTYRVSGGYFFTPRWGNGKRKGRVTGSVAGVYSPEELKSKTETEVYDLIQKDLSVNAYEDAQTNHLFYKSGHWAENLESTLCYCPKCRTIGNLTSTGNQLRCSCGFTMELDEQGFLHMDGETKTIYAMDELQKTVIESMVKTGEVACLFEDSVSLREIDKNHQVVRAEECKLKAYSDHFTMGEETLSFDDIVGIGINQKNLLLMHIAGKDGHVECRGDSGFNALKYQYVFRAIKGSPNGML